MALKVDGTTITVTRGDTAKFQIGLFDNEGNEYIPQVGDVIRFALKEDYDDANTLIYKIIPNDTRILRIDPEDTKDFPQPSSYVYDIQITYANGEVDTFINKAKFKVTEEVE